MVDATNTTALPIGHKLTDTQAPVVQKKNIFHLFRFTQSVKNQSYSQEYRAEVYCSQLSFKIIYGHCPIGNVNWLPNQMKKSLEHEPLAMCFSVQAIKDIQHS